VVQDEEFKEPQRRMI
jgi:hypothetical protein